MIVNNERGQALDDRFVEILDAEGKVIAGAFTSGCGRMSANVPEGELTVRVEIASLVEPFTQRVHYPGGRLTKTITVRHQD